ncbi:SDR family NAD(P)-dependent oxidoreductase [Streptomyces albidoflavus]
MEHAIVTGGAGGIGAAVVDRLRARGLRVTVLDLAEGPPKEGVDYRPVDVTDREQVDAAVTAAGESHGTVRHLVTSHGIRGGYVPALDLDADLVRRVLDVHVVGTLLVAGAVVRGIRRTGGGGSVVTLSSTTAYGGWERQADYGVAKAAVRQLTQNLAMEWAALGVRVNAVAPAHTLTPMVQELIDQGYDIAATEERIPLGRLCTPEEMAASIEHLLLDASFVTGVCLPVDGGWTSVGK